MSKVLLAPLDPVHDNAIKLLDRRLRDAGYETIVLPPGTTPEEVVESGLKNHATSILVSRTLGYKVGEILGRLVDLAEASGLRDTARLGIGGMAITKEVGAELGFDATFVGELDMAEVLAFLEGRPVQARSSGQRTARPKPDLAAGFTYQFKDRKVESLLDSITEQLLDWTQGKTSPGVERAKIRAEMIAEGVATHDCADKGEVRRKLVDRYVALCDANTAAFYREGKLPGGVRWLLPEEVDRLPELLQGGNLAFRQVRHVSDKPRFFIQYGTGCPIMDVVHIKTAEAWGIDGAVHICPSWAAQSEGLLEGYLSHQHDGTILTIENLRLIRSQMEPSSLWVVRGHRGLNTPEAQVLAWASGADILKINIPYGGTAGGTDPERLAVDGTYSVRLAAEYGLPYDIPGNDELSGVPPAKTFAGLLIMTMLGLKLGAKPIPKPLLCYSPHMVIYGHMDDNMVDMNVAKLAVWREIVDAPVWPGEPVGFMSHTPDRVQSSVATAAHATLAATMAPFGVTAVTIASSDEAYSKGPISAQARVDAIRAVHDLLRFVGSSRFEPTPAAQEMRERLHTDITAVLERVAARGDVVASIYEGLMGDEADGLYPGRTGRGTIVSDPAALAAATSADARWHRAKGDV